MPLFEIDQKDAVEAVEQRNFETERKLQRLVEANLSPLSTDSTLLLQISSQTEPRKVTTAGRPAHVRGFFFSSIASSSKLLANRK